MGSSSFGLPATNRTSITEGLCPHYLVKARKGKEKKSSQWVTVHFMWMANYRAVVPFFSCGGIKYDAPNHIRVRGRAERHQGVEWGSSNKKGGQSSGLVTESFLLEHFSHKGHPARMLLSSQNIFCISGDLEQNGWRKNDCIEEKKIQLDEKSSAIWKQRGQPCW